MGLELTEDVIRENMPEYLPGAAHNANQVRQEATTMGRATRSMVYKKQLIRNICHIGKKLRSKLFEGKCKCRIGVFLV